MWKERFKGIGLYLFGIAIILAIVLLGEITYQIICYQITGLNIPYIGGIGVLLTLVLVSTYLRERRWAQEMLLRVQQLPPTQSSPAT